MNDARTAALDVLDQEGMSEVQVAAVLGVDRMTVRKWRGKR
ncbi:helix-turn-helix domain-containing protein [Mycolicibacterium frederiksbergense]